MEVQFGPNSVDEPNLLYKLQSKVKVFNTVSPLSNRGYNLVASSSKYGLVFIGVPSGTLSVYQLHHLISKESEPQHMTILLPDKPTHVSVSCDYELLAVTGKTILCIYKVTDFQNPKKLKGYKSAQNVNPVLSFKYDLSSPSYVSAIQWNPCIPDSIALAFYNGTLLVYQVATGQVKKITSKARCICWSPKGKQLVTGNSDGSLHQFKPDLTPAKAIPAPNLFEGAPVEALAVYWISTFQFAVVYKNASDASRPSVTIINTPKGGQPSCLNYEDICYSMGSNRPWYYFLHGVAQWNMILSASSNSMELATIGSADGANWLQWCQPDEARPELPLTDKKQENYPVGVCIDLCAIHQLPWGENETLPHMPLLHVVSQTGLLTIFNVINLSKQAPQICSPPQQITLPAEALFSDVPGEGPKEPESASPLPETKPQVAPPPMSAPAPASIFNASPAAPLKVPSFTPSAIPTTVPSQPDVKPAPVLPPKPQPTIPPELPPKKPPTQPPLTQAPTQPPENAAFKAEQERINKAKANQELKNMLVKEVNDFQNDLYNFMLKTRETQARIQRDIESINSNFNFNSLDTEELKKECSIDELRNAVVQLKLELVRACAVIAEARTHSNAREYHKWSQADPLTAKRVASVEKMAYYVQTQLDQAQEALAYKWNKARENENTRPGKRMIRPILDDVYQPLVTQQEILGRQQAVLRTLRRTLSECDLGPVFKSSSLLRNTPFRSKDPLSKLTKNILNMSIEPQNAKLAKGLLTVQKLEALKDALSNRKTVKIKPVNVELRQHFVSMKEKYEKIIREKMAHAMTLADLQDKEPEIQPKAEYKAAPHQVKVEPKIPEPMKQEVKFSASAPSQSVFTAVDNKAMPAQPSVVRTLFNDEIKQEQPTPPKAPFSVISLSGGQQDASVLKYLLQARSQANVAGDAKTDANNIFMGQKICSPTGMSRSSAPTTSMSSSLAFSTGPGADTSSIFSKLQTAMSTSKPATVFTDSQLPTSQTAPTFSENQLPKSKPTPTSAENQPPKPAPSFGETQPPKSKSAPAFGETQPPKAKPVPSSSENQLPTTKPAPILAENQQPKIHSETGEPDSVDPPKDFKPMVNLFQLKPSSASSSIPDVLKFSELKGSVKIAEKQSAKENKSDEMVEQKTEKLEVKPLGPQAGNKGFAFGSTNNSSPSNESKPLDLKSKSPPASEKSDTAKTAEPKPTSTTAVPKPPIIGTSSSTVKDPTPPKDSTPPKETTPKESTPPKSESDKPAESKSPASSIFGAAVVSQPKTQNSSIFATANPQSVFGTKSVLGSSLTSLGQTSTTQSSPASVFASSEPAITPDAKPDTDTVTSTSDSTSSVFSSVPAVTTVTSSGFTTPSSVFGQAAGAFAPTTTSLFTSTSSTFGGFGTTTQAPAFETTSTASSVFGTANQAFGNTTPTTQAGSIFGAPGTQASVFGTAAPTPSVFGATQTTQASVFGATQTTTSVFGASSQTTQPSVFGTPTQTTQASVFGTPTQTTQASLFGTPTQTTQASSVFGTPTQTTQASVFGTPTQTTQASLFGTPTQTTQASLFGAPTQTQTSVFGATSANNGGSLFGGGEANLFASASISTTSAPTGTSGNIFGGSSTTSVFGGGNNNVFGKTTFGQPNTAASIFGGASSFGQQKPASNLWAGGSNTGFGSAGFGGQQTTQASSIFGGGNGSFSTASAGAFGSTQQTPAFGTGDSQAASVFGSPQQGATGFGGSPVFGSNKPAFGQPAGFGSPTAGGGGGFGGFGGGFNKSPSAFGAPAAFGSGATFGGNAFGNTSPGKVFGGSPASFGATPQQQSNATFENLASQNTLTFGSLAQSPQQQQPQQPSFNTSPSFTGWRG